MQRKPRKPESSLAEVSFAADCGGSDDSLLLNRALQEGLQLCALLAGAADVTGPGPVAWRLRCRDRRLGLQFSDHMLH